MEAVLQVLQRAGEAPADPSADDLSERFVDELLRGLSAAPQASHVLALVRQTDLLSWLSTTRAFTRLLHSCAARGHVGVLERAVATAPARVDDRDARGRTALMCAADALQLFAVARLLDIGASPSAVCNNGNTALHYLARRPLPPKSTRSLATMYIEAAASAAKSAWQGFPSIMSCATRPGAVESEPAQLVSEPSGSAAEAVPRMRSMESDEDDSNSSSDEAEAMMERGVTPVTTQAESRQSIDGFAASLGILDGGAADFLDLTVRRLARVSDMNARNNEGATALQMALDHGNSHVARVLKELGGVVGMEPPGSAAGAQGVPPGTEGPIAFVSATVSAASANIARYASQLQQSVNDGRYTIVRAVKRRLLHQAIRDEFLSRVREILDEKPRVSVPRITHAPGSKYRVLALDGGGVRCVMHCIILRRIVERFPGCLDNINLYCVCSGSVPIAVSHMCGVTLEQIGKLIDLAASSTLTKRSSNGLTRAKYTSKWIMLEAQVVMGTLRLCDLPRGLVIPSYKLDNGLDEQRRMGEAHIFNNLLGGDVAMERCVDVAMRSAAAPTYFASHQGFVDGAMVANNAAGCAWPLLFGKQPTGLEMSPKDVACLSIGTGKSAEHFMGDRNVEIGGVVQWATHLVDVFMTAQMSAIDVSSRAFLGDAYHRVQPLLPAIVPLDDVRNAAMLRNIAETMPLDDTFRWIEEHWL